MGHVTPSEMMRTAAVSTKNTAKKYKSLTPQWSPIQPFQETAAETNGPAVQRYTQQPVRTADTNMVPKRYRPNMWLFLPVM